MATSNLQFSKLHSLKTQLVAGSILLLAVTVASISYSLVVHEKRILTNEIEKTIVFQGRNIALSSEKALLRADPEFELFPRAKRILADSDNITSVVITDAEGLIVGDKELQNIGKRAALDLSAYTVTTPATLAQHETLYQNKDTYLLRTPVKSLDKSIGDVYLGYSKRELHASIKRAITITVVCSVLALLLGVVLSLLLFRRISSPMDTLVEGVNEFGEGQLATKIELTTRNEFRILADSFNDMADKIIAAQTELIAKERMDHELKIAHDIQATLIPAAVCEPEGFEIGIHYSSATEVGGDYLDVVQIDSHRLAIVLADVSGKGVPGLVVTAMLKVMIQELTSKNLSPQELIRRLNVLLPQNIRPSMFVTLFFGILDTRTNVMTYSNAGHNPIVIYKSADKAFGFYRMQGPPLAIYRDREFKDLLLEYQVKFEPGDLILQYTDGINESCNEKGAQFHFDGMSKVIENIAEFGAKALVKKLVAAELAFRGSVPPADDIALLAISAAPLGASEQPYDSLTGAAQ